MGAMSLWDMTSTASLPHPPPRQAKESESAIVARINAAANQHEAIELADDVGNLFSRTHHGCGLLREAQHARNVEGNSQVCIGAQVDVSTLSPAIITTIRTVRGQWTTCDS